MDAIQIAALMIHALLCMMLVYNLVWSVFLHVFVREAKIAFNIAQKEIM